MSINQVTFNNNQQVYQNPQKATSPSNSKITQIAKAIFWTIAIPFDPIIGFFTQGLSDFLGLETLRHGTRFQNYISIRINGADPSYGGDKKGATYGALNGTYPDDVIEKHAYIKASKGYFHVSKDTPSNSFTYTPSLSSKLTYQFNIRFLLPRSYCFFSSKSSLSNLGFLKKIVVALNVLLVPTLNFRFKPETLIEKFENDSHSAGSAWKTKEKINTDHIGLRGILTQGLDGKALTRIKAHPVKATWGLIRLINPIGITIFATIGLYLTVNKASEHLSRLFIHPIAPQIALA